MSTLLGVAWTLVALVGIVVAYAVACSAFLLFVQFPTDSRYGVLEDVAFVATVPFVAATVGLSLVSIEGWR